MIKDIRKVSNPLTIIAIFAALAEVSGTVALGLVSESLQEIFIWFVMIFPILIVLLFFLTLNFNPRVLYSPTDFSNEDNFLKMIEVKEKVEASFEEILDSIEKDENEISKKVGSKITAKYARGNIPLQLGKFLN